MKAKRTLRADKHRVKHPADKDLSNNAIFKKYGVKPQH